MQVMPGHGAKGKGLGLKQWYLKDTCDVSRVDEESNESVHICRSVAAP